MNEMKKNNQRIVKFQMTGSLREETLSDLLSAAMSIDCGFDFWKWNEDEYKKAKASVCGDEDRNEPPCMEDVLARLLFDGGKLSLLEKDSGWHWKNHGEDEILLPYQIKKEEIEPVGGTWHEVGLDDILKGVTRALEDNGWNDPQKLVDDGDSLTADAVFQYAAYGEIMMS